jgi:hypothetical protein
MLDSDVVATLITKLGDDDWQVRHSTVNMLVELARHGTCLDSHRHRRSLRLRQFAPQIVGF